MIRRKISVLLIGFLLFFGPLDVYAEGTPGFSADVAAYLQTDGMTVFEDPEIKTIQAELAGYDQTDSEDLTDEEREKATDLVDHLLSSIERVAKEYMSGERVPEKPVHTVQNYKELSSCVDDGSCSEEEQPELTQQPQLTEQSEQSEQSKKPTSEERISFGEMLNNNQTGSLEAIRESLKL